MIVFNSKFEILNWQRIKLSDVKILKLECSSETTQFQNSNINQMKEFVHLFQLEINHLHISFKSINMKIQINQDFIDFIIKDVIAKYADQITKLTIENFTQSITNKQQEQDKKEILFNLLLPLKNLKYIYIEHNYYKFQIERGNVLLEILDVLTSNDQFKNIEYFSILQENTEFEDESLRSKKNEMMSFQNKIIQTISNLQSLKNLQISILNMNFNQDFYKKAYQKISEMENLEQVGLDLWSKNCSLKQQIQNLKYLTKFGKTLKEITFLSDNYCKPDDAKQLKVLLLQFENVKDLCIKGVKFQQKPQLDCFMSYFNSYNNLKNLTLDLSDSSIKKLDINQFLYQSLKDCKQIEELNLTYPTELQFIEKEYQDLQTLLLPMENTLKNLSLTISSYEDCEEGYETFRKIINLKNLMVFQFKYIDNVIQLDAVEDEVENIRKIKSFQIDKPYSSFLSKLEFTLLLQLQDLKNLYLNQYSLDQIQFSENDFINQLEKFQLESFIFYPQSQIKYQQLIISIVNMNKLSLKHLNCYFYQQIETLPNLVSLTTEYQFDVLAYGLLQKVPSIVIFDGRKNMYFQSIQINQFQKLPINPIQGELQIIKNNFYITQLTLNQSQVFQNYLQNKKAMLAHLVIYCQLIKPFIPYQANFLHWDLSIDF
ncbi:hypothetical protein ABPG72_021490 [Tetrahymena utriculariae]